jgi:alpha-1,2-mannosyltransferase
LSIPPAETLAMRRRARVSAQRFTEGEFARKWLVEIEKLMELAVVGEAKK